MGIPGLSTWQLFLCIACSFLPLSLKPFAGSAAGLAGKTLNS